MTVEWVSLKYGQCSCYQLMEFNKRPNTPWSDFTDDGRLIKFGKLIPDDRIRDYYAAWFPETRAGAA